MSAVLPATPTLGANSINLRLDEYKDTGYLTHNLHPYPAKFIPQIPNEIIRHLTDEGDWVLDPFCGSGTSLVECSLLGRNCVGTDVNPLSCKISAAKVTRFNAKQLARANAFLQLISDAMPASRADVKLPKFFGIDKWFQRQVQRDLAGLLYLIRELEDPIVRNFAEVIFSSIVVKVSNQESDTRYKAIDKQIPAGYAREIFLAKLRDALTRSEKFAQIASDVRSDVFQLDSTSESAPTSKKFRLAVTSPPYMNSYDYYLYHKHRMSWLGLDVAGTQEKEFGSRNKHNDKGLGLDVYNDAVARSIALTRAQLTDDGVYCVIVGDAIWRGDLIKMNENYDSMFTAAGYRKVREIVFPQRKYTRAFTVNLRTQHKDSYVLIYAKE